MDMTRRLTNLAIELYEFDVSFEARKALKSQLFVDFRTKMTLVPLDPN